jgi:bacterioferritin-associated ferredoxin
MNHVVSLGACDTTSGSKRTWFDVGIFPSDVVRVRDIFVMLPILNCSKKTATKCVLRDGGDFGSVLLKITQGISARVYVCSCNVLTDTDVRAVAGMAATVSQVYRTLGCQAQCGSCARTIKRLLDECRHEAGCGCDTICPPDSVDCPAIERAITAVQALEIALDEPPPKVPLRGRSLTARRAGRVAAPV